MFSQGSLYYVRSRGASLGDGHTFYVRTGRETRCAVHHRVFSFSGGCCAALLRMLSKNFLANHQLDVHFCIEFLCVAYR